MKTRLHLLTHDDLTMILSRHYRAAGEKVVGIEAEVHTVAKRMTVKVLTASDEEPTAQQVIEEQREKDALFRL